MLILTQKEVQKILPLKEMKKVIEVVERAFLTTVRDGFRCLRNSI